MSPCADPIEKTVFRKTNAHTGRRLAVTPANSAMRHLSYGRIILNHAEPLVSFSNEQQETGLICLAGNGAAKSAGREHNLERFDAIYIPHGSEIEVSTKTAVDFAEISAPVEGNCQQCESGTSDRRFHLFRPRKLDQLASARTRKNAGRNLCVL